MTSLQKFLFVFGWMMAMPIVLYTVLLIGLAIISWWRRLHVRYGRCRVCGCTDKDCTECVAATGEPCWWIDSSHTLCSRCAEHLEPADVDDVFAGCSPLNAIGVSLTNDVWGTGPSSHNGQKGARQ
jgi:hypothetical protein